MRPLLFLMAGLTTPALADTPARKLDNLLAELPREGLLRSALGVTRKQTPIPFVATADDLDPATKKVRVLLVGGLDEPDESVKTVIACLKWLHTTADGKAWRDRFSVSAVPCLNVDDRQADLSRGYPPKGEAYSDPANPEAVYLWRWLGVFAPDLVLVVRSAETKAGPDSLVTALGRHSPAGVGTVAAREVVLPAREPGKAFAALLKTLEDQKPSAARQEIRKRIARTPLETARQLAGHYGQDLRSVEYIGGMALVGRLQLGELTKDARHRADVDRIVAPYLRGTRSAGTDKAGPAQLAGHLVFGELARLERDPRCIELLRQAADRCLGKDGVPGHSEMSDAVFMGCPLLARTGALTGERKYFEACERNLALMRKLCLRGRGLYQHSPLDRTAWGRGNGFPALGLALSLSDLPADYPGREAILTAFREHVTALLDHQDLDGSWHQVIDFVGSYRELSCTCMIAFAMARGVREGWLDRKTYEPGIKKAWQAIKARVSPDGSLIDVCTGTGKQKSFRDYLDRKAILGPDPRGGAMALLVAVEMGR